MKESTKLILAYVGSAVASNMVLASPVASATGEFPRAAAGAEGALALGGAAGAWRLKGKARLASAIVGGLGAGLLVDALQSGILTAPPAKLPGGATPQSLPKAPSSGAALPGPATSIPVQGTTVARLPGYTSVSGQVPPGASIPTPNRPPNASEISAYNAYLEKKLQEEQIARAQMAQDMRQGSIPTVSTPAGDGEGSGVFDWLGGGQSGAAFRITGGRSKAFRGSFG